MSRQTTAAVVPAALAIMAVIASAALLNITFAQGPAVSVAFGIFVGLLLWSLSDTQVTFYCLILAALGEALYKGMVPSLFTLLIKDIFLMILVLRLLWASQRNGDYRWLHQPFTSYAVLLTLYCIALMSSPTTNSMLLALAGLRTWILWMPLFYPAYVYFRDRKTIMRFLMVLMAVHLPISIYGIVQGNIGYEHTKIIPGFYNITKFYQSDIPVAAAGEDAPPEATGADALDRGSRPIMNVRACSIHISPGAFGGMSALLVLFSIGMAFAADKRSHRMWALISALAAAGGMLASGSRAPVFGLAGGLVALVVLTPRKAGLIAGLILVAMASIFVLKDITGGGATRLEKRLSIVGALARTSYPFKIGFQAGLDHPFGSGIATGVGAGRVFYNSPLRSAEGYRWVENEFGRALTELGFVGTFFWLMMLYQTMAQCVRVIRQLGGSPDANVCAAMFGGMMTVFVQLSVGSALYGAHPGLYFWLLAAGIIRLGELAAEQRKAEAGEAPAKAEAPALPEAVGYRSVRFRGRNPAPPFPRR